MVVSQQSGTPEFLPSDRGYGPAGMLLAGGGIQKYQPFANGRRTVPCGHALVVQLDAGSLVTMLHLGEGLAEETLEIVHSVVVGAELFLEGRPGDEGRFAG